MATLKQAETARAQFADELAALGAHAIGVENEGDDEWVVVAFLLPGSAPKLPQSLKLRIGEKAVEVPIKIQWEEAFRPE